MEENGTYDKTIENYNDVMLELQTLIQNTTDSKLLQVYKRLEKKLKADYKVLKTQLTCKNKCSSNLPYLIGVFNVVKQSANVQQVICDMRKHKLIIDVISDDGRTWKKVVARNPQSLHLIWASDGQYGNKDAVMKIQKYITAARTESDFAPPKVVSVFTNGVTFEMAKYLEDLGVEVEGERVAVSEDTLRRLHFEDQSTDGYSSDDERWKQNDRNSDDLKEVAKNEAAVAEVDSVAYLRALDTHKKIFLDVTSMVIHVSDVCNGGEHFSFKDKLMAEQAEDERATPVKPLLVEYMKNRKLITCHAALKNFRDFLELLGGEKEKQRASELIESLVVVPDCISDKFKALKIGGKVSN